MRSVLTCLGIIIGIAAVIAMMEIGQGSSNAIQQTIVSMGANQIGIGYLYPLSKRTSIYSAFARRDVPFTCSTLAPSSSSRNPAPHRATVFASAPAGAAAQDNSRLKPMT